MSLTATLVTDGSSDRVLLHILRWLLGQITDRAVEVRWGDVRGLPSRPHTPRNLRDTLDAAVDLYPCQLLFVHRDAEKQEPTVRYEERAANSTGVTHVCVVTVRMVEAWLLHDERAIRAAAGRPSSDVRLELYSAAKWEELPDPKEVLYRALITANGAKGRRAKMFRPEEAAHRLAEIIEDWSALRQLQAFQRLEADLRAALARC